jgi:hypothetical protein
MLNVPLVMILSLLEKIAFAALVKMDLTNLKTLVYQPVMKLNTET